MSPWRRSLEIYAQKFPEAPLWNLVGALMLYKFDRESVPNFISYLDSEVRLNNALFDYETFRLCQPVGRSMPKIEFCPEPTCLIIAERKIIFL
jgi:hypothetical protein